LAALRQSPASGQLLRHGAAKAPPGISSTKARSQTGNPRCRHALIRNGLARPELQPDYWAVKKFQPRMDKPSRARLARKKLIVALARHIGVDLWRLYTAQTTLAKLGLVSPPGRDYV